MEGCGRSRNGSPSHWAVTLLLILLLVIYVQRGKFACALYVYLSLLELLGILTSPKKG